MGLHTGQLIRQRRWNAFDPLNAFWAGVLVVYVLQPLSNGELYDSWHPQGVMERSCFWIFVSMCFVIVGYESRLGSNLMRKVPPLPARLHPLKVQWFAYIAIAIGAAGYVYQFSSAGGFENWAAVGRGGTDWKAVSAGLAQMADLLPFGIALLILEVELHGCTPGKRVIAWGLGGGMWLWLFYLGSRSRIIVYACALLACYYIPRRRNPSRLALALCSFVLLVAAEFLGQYRSQFTDLSLNIQSEDLQSIGENVLPAWLGGNPESDRASRHRGAEFNCVMSVIEVVPDAVPFDKGRALLEFVTRPIPRQIWPEKRYPALEYITPIMEAASIPGARIETSTATLIAGPAFTFVGYWYGIGGPVALGVMGFFTGALFRLIRGFYDRGTGEADAILYMTLAPIAFTEAAGVPLFFVFTLPYTLVPVLIAFRICRENKPAVVRQGLTRRLQPFFMS